MALSHLLDTTPPSLLTTAACGGLRPAPDYRSRRALLHLSYSSAPAYSDGASVTHAPQPTLQVASRDPLGCVEPIFSNPAGKNRYWTLDRIKGMGQSCRPPSGDSFRPK